MKSSTRTFGLAFALFGLGGCGLKGPLYLPDDKAQEVPAPTSQPALEGSKVRVLQPAPQSQKKDRTQPQRTDPSTPNQSQPPPVSPPDPDRPASTPPPQAGQ
ncbi:LPS translocon maturation chaperone LptM [Peristeroidobacter soli]|jgi:predicted small lipoprotein YifL|uniref:LPS translocon maturation chaperone LptM n=1 Tax=Peristeroidobacter soli TaxID=2497877 RepID=UPI00101BC705|nr:lipoprotein [Peristeroidobacter soli]